MKFLFARLLCWIGVHHAAEWAPVPEWVWEVGRPEIRDPEANCWVCPVCEEILDWGDIA